MTLEEPDRRELRPRALSPLGECEGVGGVGGGLEGWRRGCGGFPRDPREAAPVAANARTEENCTIATAEPAGVEAEDAGA